MSLLKLRQSPIVCIVQRSEDLFFAYKFSRERPSIVPDQNRPACGGGHTTTHALEHFKSQHCIDFIDDVLVFDDVVVHSRAHCTIKISLLSSSSNFAVAAFASYHIPEKEAITT